MQIRIELSEKQFKFFTRMDGVISDNITIALDEYIKLNSELSLPEEKNEKINCVWCGKTFEKDHHSKKFCSKDCMLQDHAVKYREKRREYKREYAKRKKAMKY